jgi:hypothetical protein
MYAPGGRTPFSGTSGYVLVCKVTPNLARLQQQFADLLNYLQ